MERRQVAADPDWQLMEAEAAGERRAPQGPQEVFCAACYENQVPPWIEDDLARCYGSLYSSLPLLRVYGSLGRDVSTWVLQSDGQAQAIFLFRVRSSVLTVINEGMQVEASHVSAFSRWVFSHYPTVNVLQFSSIDWKGGASLRNPHQHFQQLENIVLSLPANVAQYHASLSKNVRRNLKRYGERLLREHPAYSWSVSEGGAVAEADVRAVINLNVQRMASKNKVSAYDESETARMVALVRECGLVGVGRVGGKVCAGAISFRTGAHYALSVIAHDPAFNEYSLGMLAAYQIICACLERGAREFHFLWGRYDYKFLLGARERPLARLVLYRSWMQVLMHPDIWLNNGRLALRRRGMERLQHILHEQGRGAQVLMALLRGLRLLRAALGRGLALRALK